MAKKEKEKVERFKRLDYSKEDYKISNLSVT